MDIAHTAAPVSDMSAKPGEHQGASRGARVPVASARRMLQVSMSVLGILAQRPWGRYRVLVSLGLLESFKTRTSLGGGEVGRLRCLSESQEDGAPWALLPRRGGRLRGQGTGPRDGAPCECRPRHFPVCRSAPNRSEARRCAGRIAWSCGFE